MKKLSKNWTTVTPFSKALALFIFATFPIMGYFLGRWVQKAIDIANTPPPSICVPPRLK
jgi:hypothetical protein